MNALLYFLEFLAVFFGSVAYCFLFLAVIFGGSWLIVYVLFKYARLTKKAAYLLILLLAIYSVRCNQAKAVSKQQLITKAARGW